MSTHPKTRLLLPLLTLSLTLATAASAQSQDYRNSQDHRYSNDRSRDQDNSTGMSIQVNFGGNPRWSGIRGTRIQEIRGTNRPQYDMFRYGGSYYVYDNDRWYSSRRARGQFMAIDERNVPREFTRVSRDHWRNASWMDRNRNSDDGRRGRRHYSGG